MRGVFVYPEFVEGFDRARLNLTRLNLSVIVAADFGSGRLDFISKNRSCRFFKF